jgi:hypothetical protein
MAIVRRFRRYFSGSEFAQSLVDSDSVEETLQA